MFSNTVATHLVMHQATYWLCPCISLVCVCVCVCLCRGGEGGTSSSRWKAHPYALCSLPSTIWHLMCRQELTHFFTLILTCRLRIMAIKHELTLTGLLIFISIQGTCSVSGKHFWSITSVFKNLHKLTMISFRNTLIDFKFCMQLRLATINH